MVYIFLAEGFEETEAIAPGDILIRGGVGVTYVSVTGTKTVTGTHGIKFEADALFEDCDFSDAETIVLPGGMPGTNNLGAHAGVVNLFKENNAAGKKVAAICAAPMVLGLNGILAGKKATCYPGCEGNCKGADMQKTAVVTDGNVTTSQGPGTAVHFGLELLKNLKGKETADQVAKDFLFQN